MAVVHLVTAWQGQQSDTITITIKPLTIMKKLFFLAGLLLTVAHPVFSMEISSELEISSEEELSESDTSFQFELGLIHIVADIPLVGILGSDDLNDYTETTPLFIPIIIGRFDYNNFFIQAGQGGLTDTAIGYSLHDTERSQLDLVVVSFVNVSLKRNNIPGLENIQSRSRPPLLGFSHNLNFGNNYFRSELVGGTFSRTGTGYSAHFSLGREIQLGNWSLNGSLIAAYTSAAELDHFFGISPSEASGDYPEFSPGGGVATALSVGVTYPVTEKVVFRTGASHALLHDSIADSPLVLGDSISTFHVGLSYVFGGG